MTEMNKEIKELVIISGKGGTGKTSITAAFAALAENAVLADCDVDAADLHLITGPRIERREEFRCGHEAGIRQKDCISCGACLARCRFRAVRKSEGGAGEANFTIDPTACEGCGVCVWSCPVKAIDFPERTSGEWFISSSRYGTLVHARLNPGAENSGKLVSIVRRQAQRIANEQHCSLILIDGPPGIGCPVIASVTGASLLLIVTEPTLSGAHDTLRVLKLARHFTIPAVVCVNKWDINPTITEQIEKEAKENNGLPAGRIRYDQLVTEALIHGKPVVELDGSLAGVDIRLVWNLVETMLKEELT